MSFAIASCRDSTIAPSVVIAVEEAEHQAVEVAHFDVAEAEVRDPGVGFGLESGQGAGERAFAGLRRDPGGMEVELDEIRPEALQHQGREPVAIVPGVGGRRGRSLPEQRLDLVPQRVEGQGAWVEPEEDHQGRLDEGMVRRESSDPVGRAELLLRSVEWTSGASETGLARVEMCMVRTGSAEGAAVLATSSWQSKDRRNVRLQRKSRYCSRSSGSSDHPSIAAFASGEIPSKRPSDRASPK